MIKSHVEQRLSSNPNYENRLAMSKLSSASDGERPKHKKLNPFNNFKQQRFKDGSLEFVPHLNNESPQFKISQPSPAALRGLASPGDSIMNLRKTPGFPYPKNTPRLSSKA